jgi:hypothetical protein
MRFAIALLAMATLALSGCQPQNSQAKASPEVAAEPEPAPKPEPKPEPKFTDILVDRETTKSGSIKRLRWHLKEDGDPCYAAETALDVTNSPDGTISWEGTDRRTEVSANEYSLMKAAKTMKSHKSLAVSWCNDTGRVNRYLVMQVPSRRIWQTTVYDRKW